MSSYKNLTTKELWDTLKHHQDSILPFGIPFEKLYALYENSNECPMQVSSQNKNSCGTNRNGCVICMMIEEDKMLLFQRDIQNVHGPHHYLNLELSLDKCYLTVICVDIHRNIK